MCEIRLEWAGPWAFTGSREPVTVDCELQSLPYQLQPYKAFGGKLPAAHCNHEGSPFCPVGHLLGPAAR